MENGKTGPHRGMSKKKDIELKCTAKEEVAQRRVKEYLDRAAE